ncbi:MAG: hypothetical protein DI566_06350 [Microbacterium sp.]|nr:MAG: hypothetical protein DI566_06350 [Microbacterium sp.]
MRRAKDAGGRAAVACGVVAMTMALLAGCSAPALEPSPSASGGASRGASASAAPTTPAVSPSATAGAPTTSPGLSGPLTLPACVDLLPLSVAQDQLGDGTVPLDIWETASEVMPGPAAADAVRGAVASQICAWGIPNSDGGFHVVAAELTPASAASLIASLRAAGTFTEQSVPGGVSFARDLDSEIGSFAVAYVFVDSAWTTAVGSLVSASARDVAVAAMDAVAAANGG